MYDVVYNLTNYNKNGVLDCLFNDIVFQIHIVRYHGKEGVNATISFEGMQKSRDRGMEMLPYPDDPYAQIIGRNVCIDCVIRLLLVSKQKLLKFLNF